MPSASILATYVYVFVTASVIYALRLLLTRKKPQMADLLRDQRVWSSLAWTSAFYYVSLVLVPEAISYQAAARDATFVLGLVAAVAWWTQRKDRSQQN